MPYINDGFTAPDSDIESNTDGNTDNSTDNISAVGKDMAGAAYNDAAQASNAAGQAEITAAQDNANTEQPEIPAADISINVQQEIPAAETFAQAETGVQIPTVSADVQTDNTASEQSGLYSEAAAEAKVVIPTVMIPEEDIPKASVRTDSAAQVRNVPVKPRPQARSSFSAQPAAAAGAVSGAVSGISASAVTGAAASVAVGAATAGAAFAGTERPAVPVSGRASGSAGAQRPAAPAGEKSDRQPAQKSGNVQNQAAAQRPAAGKASAKEKYETYHMVIEAETAEDGLEIAIDELKVIHKEHGITNSVAKSNAAKLNEKGLSEAALEKLKGRDFIIENAGDLDEDILDTVYELVKTDRSGMIIVLIDTPEGLDRIEDIRPEIFDVCDLVSDFEDEFEDGEYEDGSEDGSGDTDGDGFVEDGFDGDRRSYKEGYDESEPGDDEEDGPYEDEDGYDGGDDGYEDEDDYGDEDRDDEGSGYEDGYEDDYRDDDRQDVRSGRKNADKTANSSNKGRNRSDAGAGADKRNSKRAVSEDEMEIDDFAQYCVSFATKIDCVIPGKSMLALYEKIELMEEDGIALTRDAAEDLINDAADRAEKPPILKRAAGIFHSKYDKNGMLILKEEDFIR